MQIDVTVIISAGLSLFAAMLVSFISTPLAKAFAKKVGAIDVPKDARRVHDHPIPRLGGLAIFLGFVISVVLFAKIDTQLRGILLGSVLSRWRSELRSTFFPTPRGGARASISISDFSAFRSQFFG